MDFIDRYAVSVDQNEHVVIDRDVMRIEDMIVARYMSRTAAKMDADHRNLVAEFESRSHDG